MKPIQWLKRYVQNDPLLQQALDHVQSVEETPEGWRVRARSRRGVEHCVIVVRHPVTGAPERYYREATSLS